MTRKLYRSAQGKTVDLGALQLRNESVRAVGNMGVNARGDLVDSTNKPIATRNKQVSKQYNRQVTNVNDAPVISSAKSRPALEVDIPLPPEDFDDDFVKEESISDDTSKIPEGGLASAIAKARQVRQDPLKSMLPTKSSGPTRI